MYMKEIPGETDLVQVGTMFEVHVRGLIEIS